MRANLYMTTRTEREGDRRAYITEYGRGEILRTSVMYMINQEGSGGILDLKVRVEFRSGEAAEWPCENNDATSYLAQFGMSVSLDGRYVFVQTWDKGLFCYHAHTGQIAWRTKRKFGVTSIFVNERTLLVHLHDRALQLLDIENGEVLEEKTPAKDWGFYALDDECIICRTTARTWEIIRAVDLETVESIPHKRFPQDPWCIRNVWLNDGTLKVEAFRDNITLANDETVEMVACSYCAELNKR